MQMIRCRSCGTEFDGNFCPNCGKKRQETYFCSHCGARLVENWKFCTECGFPTDSDSPILHTKPMSDKKRSRELPVKSIFQKIALIMPDLFLLLFSLASFFFFLAPIAVMPGGEILGEKIPAESFGNLYQLIKPSEEGTLSPLIIFPIVAAVSALFAAYNLFFSQKHPVRIVIRYLFFLFFIVYASVIIAIINATDEGMGLMAVGNCCILILSFSVTFFVFSLAFDLYLLFNPPEKDSVAASICLSPSQSETSDEISDNAYSERDDLYSVKIEKGYRSIGKEAFRDCLRLCSVSVGEGLTFIADNAFLGCVSLKEIVLPASLREIGWYALCNCIALEKIEFNGTTEQWKHISKGGMWDDQSGEYRVICSDGILQKEQ